MLTDPGICSLEVEAGAAGWAMRSTNLVGLFPVVERPADIPECHDCRRMCIAEDAAEALCPYLPPQWSSPYYPWQARIALSQWLQEIDDLATESSWSDVYQGAIAELDPEMRRRMGDWLRGEWSTDRDALAELLWRLELGQRTISGALWLHQVSLGDA